MDMRYIFSGLVGFVIEELVIGAFIVIIWKAINYDVQVANSTGFQSTIPLLDLIFVVVLIIPVLLHVDNLREFIGI